ncbi:hypothetical protein C4D60_Mb01t15320 [Musa balbisiana]|uniref:Secreted protein n=1 Tax=Musa balbisiana TaxID=52838 RepID=A0A4V6T4H5_MUSBA|nr:hypothetical protein C4D60_Mb01t15320 [Musa balbisiana]
MAESMKQIIVAIILTILLLGCHPTISFSCTHRKALARAGRCGELDDQAWRRPYVPPSPAGNRVIIYEAPPQAPPPLVA